MSCVNRMGAALLLAGFITALPAAAQTTWTNVSPSMVVSNEWSSSTPTNWYPAVPGVDEVNLTARLTNEVNSYIVGVESAPVVFNTLIMSNSGDNLTELRIGADMDFRPGLANGFTLATMNGNSLMDVVSGTTAFNWGFVQHAGTFRVRNGAVLRTAHGSSTDGGLAPGGRMTVEGEWTAVNGGMHQNGSKITVESGGTWTIGNTSRMPNSHVAGGAIVVTNRGTVIVNHGTFQFGFSSGNQHTIFQEAGELNVNATAHMLIGCQFGLATGRGNLLITGGLVSNVGTLEVGVAGDNRGRVNTVEGLVALSVGEYSHGTQHIKVGGWRTVILEAYTMNTAAEDTVRGEIAVSGGKFSTQGNMLVANGPSKGVVTVSGGEFFVTNAGKTASLLLGGFDHPTLLRSGIATLTVSGGYVEIDRLYATNQVNEANYSIVNLHGGELAARLIVVDNTEAFYVGDGTEAAMLSLLGVGNTFEDGLVINTNATLSVGGTNVIGTAALTGNVTLRQNARLAWDFDVDDQDLLAVTGVVDLPASATLELTSLDGSTPNRIPLLTATGGFTGSNPSTWERVVVHGVTYGVVIENGDTLVAMPPRGTIFSIR